MKKLLLTKALESVSCFFALKSILIPSSVSSRPVDCLNQNTSITAQFSRNHSLQIKSFENEKKKSNMKSRGRQPLLFAALVQLISRK